MGRGVDFDSQTPPAPPPPVYLTNPSTPHSLLPPPVPAATPLLSSSELADIYSKKKPRFGSVGLWGFCPAYNHITWAAGLCSLTGRPPVWRAVRLRLLWKLIRGQITHFVSPEQSSKEGEKKEEKGRKKPLTCTHACAREQTRMCSLATAACAGQRGRMRSAGTRGKRTRPFFSLLKEKKNLYVRDQLGCGRAVLLLVGEMTRVRGSDPCLVITGRGQQSALSHFNV